MSTRTYDNTRRRERAEQTRAAILTAFAQQLGRPGATDVSVPEAARHVGVSVRTVYHYFPDHAARVAGLAAWTERVMGPVAHQLETVDDLPGFVRAAYARAKRHETLTRAMNHVGLGADARTRRLRDRRRRYRELLDTIGAPEAQTRRAAATVAVLASAEAGIPLVDNHRLTFDDAGEAAAEAVEAIIASLRHRASVGTL